MNLREKLKVEPGSKVDLAKWDADDTFGVDEKKEAKAITKNHLKKLDELQYRLYAEDKRSVLVVLQAMDAGGKDGTIRHVMGPLNPQGCRVASFKAPSAEELEHDFLWRIHQRTPRKGEMAIFNRSHYEDVLIARVRNLVPPSVWKNRYKQINDFERHLADNGMVILKFYLHITPEEQMERLKDRLREPLKHWKVNPADFEERVFWDDYIKAFEVALSRCSTSYAPWYVIPANRKWFRNLAVSQILLKTMEAMDIQLPDPVCDVEALQKKFLHSK